MVDYIKQLKALKKQEKQVEAKEEIRKRKFPTFPTERERTEKKFQGISEKVHKFTSTIEKAGGTTKGIHSFISRLGVGTRGKGITRRKEGGSLRYFLPGGVTYRVAKRPYQARGKGVGRPRGSFKQRYHPVTGQPVGFFPALQWYKIKRRMVAQAKAVQEARLMQQYPQQQQINQMQTVPQQVQNMPPQMAKNRVPLAQVQRFQPYPTQPIPPQFQRRMPERFVTHRDAFMRPRNMPMQRAPPGQIPEGVSRVRINGQIFKVITDIASGKRRLVPGSQVLY